MREIGKELFPEEEPQNTLETDTPVRVASECQVLFRIVDTEDPPDPRRDSAVFHIPPFPSLDAIDPSVKLYEKRDALDADLIETLLCMDWKINLLIKILSPIQDEAIYPYRAVITAISLQNLALRTVQTLALGTLLEFHFVLPVLPFREIFLRGEVVHTANNEYEVTLIQTDQSEADREHMIRYIVKRQFQLKREQTLKKRGAL